MRYGSVLLDILWSPFSLIYIERLQQWVIRTLYETELFAFLAYYVKYLVDILFSRCRFQFSRFVLDNNLDICGISWFRLQNDDHINWSLNRETRDCRRRLKNCPAALTSGSSSTCSRPVNAIVTTYGTLVLLTNFIIHFWKKFA